MFLSTASTQQQKFCKTRSPVIARNKQTPHTFLIKSPPSASSKFQGKIKSPPVVSLSPIRHTHLSKKSPKMSIASKLRWSFSPSRLATRLVSLLRRGKGVQNIDGLMSGLKQCPTVTPMRFFIFPKFYVRDLGFSRFLSLFPLKCFFSLFFFFFF